MNTLMDMNPWNILGDLLDDNSLALQKVRARAAGRFPPVNVFLDDNAILIDVELPGRTAKDVDLALEPQSITITDRPAEIPAGADGKMTPTKPAWSRSLDLPYRVNADKANAAFKNGILRIELPRAEAKTAHRIAIAGE